MSTLIYMVFYCISIKKPAYKNLVFFKLASVGSYINGVFCEIRLPRFLSGSVSIFSDLVLAASSLSPEGDCYIQV